MSGSVSSWARQGRRARGRDARRTRSATSEPPLPVGARFVAGLLAFAGALALLPAQASAQGSGNVLIYSGTTGYRHGGSQAINQQAIDAIQAGLADAGYTSDSVTCNGTGTGAGGGPADLANPPGCRNPDVGNPATFTSENLANYDAIYLHSASDYWSGTGGTPGQLWNAAEETAIIDFVQNGGGIAASHNMTDAGAGVETWDWWDGGPNSVVGTTMAGHAATDLNNEATVQVADHNHPSTADLPDTYEFGDEHYNWDRNVRGDHHVLATLDERTYEPGGNGMGQDHPISWCKSYDGDNVEDGTGNPKPYDDGRTWLTGMGHFAANYTENGGDNELVQHTVGGIRWAAGEGNKSDCGGTVWSNYTRTVLVSDANNPIAIDVAADGKVYWTEIGPTISNTSEGYVKMHDPEGEPNNQTTVATIPTRADHALSEDGVLGMSLEPGFDLADPTKRDIYIYYAPRFPDFTEANAYMVGYNLISRFTMTADGTAFEPGSERPILEVPKVKLNGNPSWCTGPNCSGNGPGHVGGASLVFDSNGDLYLGVGDDVAPNDPGHGGYTPLDYRAQEHRDARKTSANTGDLRGKIVRIHPLDEIAPGAEPGVGSTYSIPEGNMFPPGTENARPEIYAMGFRQPFTLHTDPANPGTIGVGEFCHDAGSDGVNRAPAGVCEWNLLSEPGFHGWPFCVGTNSPAHSSYRWDYASNTTTGQPHDCSQAQIPSDLNYAPAGQTNPGPTNPGLANIPGPAVPATIWKKTGGPNSHNPLDFGNLNAGGNQPLAGPIYRHDPDAPQGAFPPYYDGSWLIHNRGSNDGFWKEVRLRSDNNEMLRVHDWLPANQFGTGAGDMNGLTIGTRFGPDGALYLGRFAVGCCRNNITPEQETQIVKIEFNVQDECLADDQAPEVSHELEGQPHPTDPDTYLIGGLEDSADLRITADDVGCAGVDTVEYRVNSDAEEDWQPYEGPVPFDAPGEYSVDYRATDDFDPANVSEIGTATFTVEEANDTEPPAVEATVSGSQNEDGDYEGSATLELAATDEISGIESIEHNVNGGAFTETPFEGNSLTESTEVDFDEPGEYTVAYRASDTSGNTSTDEEITFTVVEGTTCPGARSDEFNGTDLDLERWTDRVEDPGQYSVEGGQLVLPILNEIDGGGTGPLAFVSQPVPEGDWSLTTRVTPDLEASWAQAGIMLWQSDGNFVKFVFGRDANSGDRRFEMTSDDPTDVRQIGPSAPVDESFPETAWIRVHRVGNELSAEFAPDEAGEPGEWQPFATTRPVDTTPPREGEGVQLGLYAGSDVDGGEYDQTAAFDFARFEPDEGECPDDTTPPVTTAQLNGAAPQPSYDGPVTATFTATDEAGGSGVESTEYRVNGGEWTAYNSLEPPMFDDPGEYVLDFRSTDVAGNVEEPPKSVEFTITGDGGDATPPETTASLDPADPGPGGTYEEPVDVTLSASDPDEPGGPGDPQTHEVVAQGFAWSPDELEVAGGDTVNWDFSGGGHDACLGSEAPDPWTVGECEPEDETLGDFADGDTGGTRTFTQAEVGQSFAFYCTYHMPSMTGTVDVVEGGGGEPVPGSGVDITEYRVNTDGVDGEWQTSENPAGDDPFETTFTVADEGDHVVEYRSTDLARNVEETGSVEFTIAGGGEPGEPDLRTRVQPRRETVKAGKTASFNLNVRNLGDAAAEGLEMCVRVPQRKVKVLGKECRAKAELGEGDSVAAAFRLKPKRSAAGDRINVRFIVTADNADRVTDSATLKVEKKKKRKRGR